MSHALPSAWTPLTPVKIWSLRLHCHFWLLSLSEACWFVCSMLHTGVTILRLLQTVCRIICQIQECVYFIRTWNKENEKTITEELNRQGVGWFSHLVLYKVTTSLNQWCNPGLTFERTKVKKRLQVSRFLPCIKTWTKVIHSQPERVNQWKSLKVFVWRWLGPKECSKES